MALTTRPSVAPSSLPTTVRLQRVLLKWYSHSRFVSFFSRFQVLLLKGVPLLSLLVVCRRAWRLSNLMKRLQKRPAIVFGKTFLEAWALLELTFWLYFTYKKKALEARRAYQPSVLWKEPGERRKLLRNFLRNINRIYANEDSTRTPGPAEGGITSRSLQRFKSSAFGVPVPTHAREHSAVGAKARLLSAPSVENFLRYCSTEDEDAVFPRRKSVDFGQVSVENGPPTPLRSLHTTSVQDLLHCLEAPSPASDSEESHELRCLKHLELCSWFWEPNGQICASVDKIGRGNIEEWILSYWFDGAEAPSALTEDEFVELQELVDEVTEWAGLPVSGAEQTWRSKDANLRCFRLRNDPFPAVHRPLFVYALTAGVGPLLGNRSLLSLGFRPYRSGSAEYWFRPPHAGQAWWSGRVGARPHKNPDWRKPVVFCHGIGAGPTMCLPFLQRLVQGVGEEHPLFLVDMGPISMRFSDDVPSAREVAANMVDMLEVWGFEQAHFIGHSFGSFLLSWMLRYQRSYVERCTFIDPVCFLLLKALVDSHSIYKKSDFHMDTMEMGIKYFVLTELFVCNFMCRCFFWEESELDMQVLHGVETLIVLESEDNLVPTHSVQRLVIAEQTRRAHLGSTHRPTGLDVLWIEGQPHAGFLVDHESNREVNAKLVAFHA